MGLGVDWGDGSVGQKVPGESRESRVLGMGGRSRQGWQLRGDPHPATLPGQSSALARTGHRARRRSRQVRCHPGRGGLILHRDCPWEEPSWSWSVDGGCRKG